MRLPLLVEIIKKLKYFGLSCGLLFISLTHLSGQQLASLGKLKHLLSQIDRSQSMEHAQWGFVLRNLKSGKILAEINGNKTLIPASTMKTVTTGAALGLLGEDFTFKTMVLHDGKIDGDGILHGNLYIKGGGDPSLGSERYLNYSTLFDNWAEKIKAAGIKKITGYVIGDGDLFQENIVPAGWKWSDIGNYYGAGISGLNINENIYRIYFQPGKVNELATLLRIEPLIADLEFVSKVKTDKQGSGDNAYIYGAPYSNYRYIEGTIPAVKRDFVIKGSMPDPALQCAQMLTDKLKKNKVGVGNIATTTRHLRQSGLELSGTSKTTLFIHHSAPLKDLVAKTNIYSLNIYAEAILKIIGLEVYREATTEAGVKAVENFWKQRGVDIDGFYMEDGSGLSPTNGITPRQLSHIFYSISKEKFYNSFYNSLAVAGTSGTCADMCKGTAAAGNIHVKSGTMTRVMGYTGYVKNKSGQQMCFTFIANKYSGDYYQMRKKVEELMVMLAEMR